MSKITIDRAVLEQAIDVLEQRYSDLIYDYAGKRHAWAFEESITALREALAQPHPAQEPVAPVGTVTRYLGNDGYMKWAFQPEAAAWLVPRDQRAAERGAESCFSVYTSPQAQPLSEEQDHALCEAYCNTASDEYFHARPQLDSSVNRRIFYAGHRKAWIEYEAAHSITKGTT